MKKKDLARLDHAVALLGAAVKQVELMKRGGSVPPPYATTSGSSTYNISYDGFHEFVGEPVEDVEVQPEIQFVSIGEQVQQAREKLQDAVFPIPESIDRIDDWAEEAAAYVARFYGQPVDRIHVELLMRPLAEMRDQAQRASQKAIATQVRNMHFESNDNLELAIAIRDQIATIIASI